MDVLRKHHSMFFFWVTMSLLIFFISGCCPVAIYGSPGDTASCKGTIILPVACMDEDSKNAPMAFASVTLYGDKGDIVQTKTDQNGEWAAHYLISSYYLLEAIRENIVVKQVIGIQSGKMNDAGVANAYTTSQVMIYEVANELFKNALYLREVPDLVIPDKLVEAVENDYRECRDPFDDINIHNIVENLVRHQF